MDTDPRLRSPQEILEKEFKEQVAAFCKEQRELIVKQTGLISDQKKHDRTIKKATIWTAIATVVMAFAVIIQCLIAYCKKDNTVILNTVREQYRVGKTDTTILIKSDTLKARPQPKP
jgi:heme/copper-type cytochrome/quinol oxidase subunit 3